jgi:hypothetical protein
MPRMTQAEVNAYLAKCASRAVDTYDGEGASKESELHSQILTECKRRGWIAFHGSMAHSTFRTKGEPDFVILGDSGLVLLIEAKTSKGKLSPDQLAIKAWANRLGHEIHVVRSLVEFLAALPSTSEAK